MSNMHPLAAADDDFQRNLDIPPSPFLVDYSQYRCETCGKQGICEEGIDVFVACLCQICYEALWQEYVEAISRSDDPCSQNEEEAIS